jgi:hypothetical protein
MLQPDDAKLEEAPKLADQNYEAEKLTSDLDGNLSMFTQPFPEESMHNSKGEVGSTSSGVPIGFA